MSTLAALVLNTIDLVELEHGQARPFRTARVCASIDELISAIVRLEREHAALLRVLDSAEFSVRVDEVSAELGRACEAARAELVRKP